MPYFSNTKMNALVYVNIDQGIYQGGNIITQDKKKTIEAKSYNFKTLGFGKPINSYLIMYIKYGKF